MKFVKYGLIVVAVLAFASFVYYRVQTIPETPQLEISFGRAGADGTQLQAVPNGPLKFIKGKVSVQPSTAEAGKE